MRAPRGPEGWPDSQHFSQQVGPFGGEIPAPKNATSMWPLDLDLPAPFLFSMLSFLLSRLTDLRTLGVRINLIRGDRCAFGFIALDKRRHVDGLMNISFSFAAWEIGSGEC